MAEGFELKKVSVIQRPDAIAIGSSTGGLKAIEEIFKEFKGGRLDIPIFITQHTPKNFDRSVVDKIKEISGFNCKLAANGEEIKNGFIYVAPSQVHMKIVKDENDLKRIELDDGPPVSYCKPSVDVMLDSIADVYEGKVIVIMLTGIGADGTEGSKKISSKGGIIIAQDEATSVVWGMPGSVAKAGICSQVLPIQKMAEYLKNNTFGVIR